MTEYECKYSKKCEYGHHLGGGSSWMCGYMLQTGEARSLKPEGEIKNGKCGFFQKRTKQGPNRSGLW